MDSAMYSSAESGGFRSPAPLSDAAHARTGQGFRVCAVTSGASLGDKQALTVHGVPLRNEDVAYLELLSGRLSIGRKAPELVRKTAGWP